VRRRNGAVEEFRARRAGRQRQSFLAREGM
jgi:hypothetical protein